MARVDQLLLVTLQLSYYVSPIATGTDRFICLRNDSSGKIVDLCVPGGQCKNKTDHGRKVQRCMCLRSHCGNMCQWKNACSSVLCHNRGTCQCAFETRKHSNPPTAKCYCYKEFTGPVCLQMSEHNPCLTKNPCSIMTECRSAIRRVARSIGREITVQVDCIKDYQIMATFMYPLLKRGDLKSGNITGAPFIGSTFPRTRRLKRTKAAQLEITTPRPQSIIQEIPTTVKAQTFEGQMKFTYQEEEDEPPSAKVQRLEALEDHVQNTLQDTIENDFEIVTQFISKIKASKKLDPERKKRSNEAMHISKRMKRQEQLTSTSSTAVVEYTIEIPTRDIRGRDFAAELTDSIKSNAVKFNLAGEFTLDKNSVLVAEAQTGEVKETKSFLTNSTAIYSIFGTTLALLILTILLAAFVLRKKHRQTTIISKR